MSLPPSQSAALSLGLIDSFVTGEKKVNFVEALCRNFAGLVGVAFLLGTACVRKFGRDKFIEYITHYYG